MRPTTLGRQDLVARRADGRGVEARTAARASTLMELVGQRAAFGTEPDPLVRAPSTQAPIAPCARVSRCGFNLSEGYRSSKVGRNGVLREIRLRQHDGTPWPLSRA